MRSVYGKRKKQQSATPVIVGNNVLPDIHFSAYINGEYRQMVGVKADSEEEAVQWLIEHGWDKPVRFEEIILGMGKVYVLLNATQPI